jgi:FemAB-related protein (PEP-CTERM system-associated)
MAASAPEPLHSRRADARAPLAGIEVRAARPADDAERDRYVLAHPRGTFFHLAGWRRAAAQAFAHEERDITAWRGSTLVGVLPLMKCARPVRGSHLVSVPYGVYGGPIGDTREIEHALCAAAIEIAERERVGRLELRCREDIGLDLPASSLYATFIHALPADAADVMKRMPKRARAEVRKAIEKHGLELECGAEHVRDVIELFHQSKQHLGSPGLPARWFQALLAEFPQHAIVHRVRRGGERVAATMSFLFRDTFLFYYIGTTAEANRAYNATNYLCTKLQEESVARGLALFDLGRSRVDSGAYDFKVHQGFEPAPLPYRFHLVTSAGLPSFTPSNPRTKLLRDAWAKLPPWLAVRLSDRLARYLP